MDKNPGDSIHLPDFMLKCMRFIGSSSGTGGLMRCLFSEVSEQDFRIAGRCGIYYGWYYQRNT